MNTFSGTLKIMGGIVSGGILPALVTSWVDWEPPPASEWMRLSKQRRTTPCGYPHNPSKNDTLKAIYNKQGKSVEEEERRFEHLLPRELEQEWSVTFTLFERLKLFWYNSLIIFVQETSYDRSKTARI